MVYYELGANTLEIDSTAFSLILLKFEILILAQSFLFKLFALCGILDKKLIQIFYTEVNAPSDLRYH